MSAAEPTTTTPRAKSYLRPNQLEDMRAEHERIESMLRDPISMRDIEDKASLYKQRDRIARQIETQSAPKLSGEALDRVRAREKELREEISACLLSSREMRACPPGAIGEYRRGEGSPEMKAKILEWKQRRMELDPQSTDPDLCNVERLRPTTTRMNLDNSLVQTRDYYIPPGPIEARNVASPEDSDRLNAEKLAMAERENRRLRHELEIAQEIQSGEHPSQGPYSETPVVLADGDPAPCGKSDIAEGYLTRHVARCMKPECIAYRESATV